MDRKTIIENFLYQGNTVIVRVKGAQYHEQNDPYYAFTN
jgi:hypothetical protein